MRPGYLLNCFHPVTSACLTTKAREDMLQTLSAKDSRKRHFSAIVPALLNTHPPGDEVGPHSPDLQERHKNMALQPSLRRTEEHIPVGLGSALKALPRPLNNFNTPFSFKFLYF